MKNFADDRRKDNQQVDLANEKETKEALLKGNMPELNWFPDEIYPDNVDYTKSYASFSGADLIVTIDGEVVVELIDIEWEEDFYVDDIHDYPISGVAKFVIFGYELSLYELAKQKKKFDICMTYQDEVGNKISYRIYDCLLTKRSGKHGVNKVVVSESYHFKAKKVEMLTKEEIDEQVR